MNHLKSLPFHSVLSFNMAICFTINKTQEDTDFKTILRCFTNLHDILNRKNISGSNKMLTTGRIFREQEQPKGSSKEALMECCFCLKTEEFADE